MAARTTAAQQALALYRRGLALSRQLTDPCMRHYAFGRITHLFRREQHETSATRVRALLHDGRKGIRRLARAAAGDSADVRHLLELAYGKRGRMMHMLARARAMLTQGRGSLAALPPATPAGEAAAAAGGAGAAVLSQLLARVPTHWRRGRRGPGGALSGPGALPPAQHSPGWEEAHVVLLERSFLPTLAQRMAALPRASRRLRESVLALPPAALLLHAPPAAEEGQPPPLAQLTWRGTVVGHAPPPPPRDQLRKRRPNAPAAAKRWGDAPPRPQEQQGGATAQVTTRRRSGEDTVAEDARRAMG